MQRRRSLISDLVFFAVAALFAVADRAPEDVEIVFQDHATKQVEESPYSHVQPKLQFADVALQIGQMLKTVSQNQPLEEQGVVAPMRLFVPRGLTT